MNSTPTTAKRTAVAADRCRQVASAREGVPEGRHRGIFSGNGVTYRAKELQWNPS